MNTVLAQAVSIAKQRGWIASPYLIQIDFWREILLWRRTEVFAKMPFGKNQHTGDTFHEALQNMLLKLFTNGFLQANACQIDTVAYSGSTNVDLRSILWSFEMSRSPLAPRLPFHLT